MKAVAVTVLGERIGTRLEFSKSEIATLRRAASIGRVGRAIAEKHGAAEEIDDIFADLAHSAGQLAVDGGVTL